MYTAFIIRVDAFLFIQKGCVAYDSLHGRVVITASAETIKSKLNIRRLQKYYTEEQMVEGFEFCVREDSCSVKELCSYFIFRYGEEKTKQYIPVHTYRHYRERADAIREVMMNGNGN